jgi:hypothetical protein
MRDRRRGSARGRAGVLSPNDVRREEDWPASNDPTADSIEPPNMSAQAAVPIEDDPPTPTPAPTADDSEDGVGDKIARLDQRRAVHASD